MGGFFKENRNFLAIIIGAAIIGGFLYFAFKDSVSVPTNARNLLAANSTQNTPILCGASNNTIVTKVIDGDTVVVEGGYHVRLLGIDADESGYPCYQPAKVRLEQLVLGKQVLLEKDLTDADQYGRCLRHVFIGGTNVDVQLVKEGLAIARFYEDVKYKPEITAVEQHAQENKIGCKWSGASQVAQ